MKMKIKNFRKILLEEINTHGKSVVAVYFILRLLVILCMILEFLRGDLNNAFLCLLSLILFLMPFFIEKKFKIIIENKIR